MRLAARAGWALLLANARYWRGVAPTVARQLAGWQRAALAIPEPAMRDAALSKLHWERFNVELAATLATISRPRQRVRVTTAIVALQVAYDYLDLLTESPGCGRRETVRMLGRLREAVQAQARAPSRHAYLDRLLASVASTLGCLPAANVVRPVAIGSVERCIAGQALGHAALDGAGEARLRSWAEQRSRGGALGWRELVAGASASVLCLHALLAAASTPDTTDQDARSLDRLYLSIGALTMLDSLVDREQDAIGGQQGHLTRYPDATTMTAGLARVAAAALAETDSVPCGAHHAMTLGGVIAYYASAPEMAQPPAGVAVRRLRKELGPLLAPPLALMRAWRAAKRLRRVRAPDPAIVMTVAPQHVSSITAPVRTDRARGVLGR
jgi:hypothetical protein